LGKDNVNATQLKKIKNQLGAISGEKTLKDTKHVTGWVYDYIRKMYGNKTNE